MAYQATASSTSTAAQAKPARKTIYLIRHAESNENTLYSGPRRLVADLTDCSLPSLPDALSVLVLPLLMFRPSITNAEVSEHGRQQIEQLHHMLSDDGFLFDHNGKRDIVVVHSPLKRARQTAYGIFKGTHAIDEMESDDGKCVMTKVLVVGCVLKCITDKNLSARVSIPRFDRQLSGNAPRERARLGYGGQD